MKKISAAILTTLLLFALMTIPASAEIENMGDGRFTLELTDGSTFDLGDYEGQVVMINFWATWCGPCVYEMPALNDLAAHYADAEDVAIVAVNCGDQIELVRSFIETKEFDALRVACDTTTIVAWVYGADAIPYTLIYGKDGKLVHSVRGVTMKVDDLCDHYIELIEALR